MRLHRVPLFLSVTGYRRIINKRSTSTIDTQNKGITAILFMGGDANPAYINKLAEYLYHNYPNLKLAGILDEINYPKRSNLISFIILN